MEKESTGQEDISVYTLHFLTQRLNIHPLLQRDLTDATNVCPLQTVKNRLQESGPTKNSYTLYTVHIQIVRSLCIALIDY